MTLRSSSAAMALVILALGCVGLTDVAAQRLPLQPGAQSGYPIVPLMEGWWDNGDGTLTVSYGYVNRNDDPIDIPIGPGNSITPAQFSGSQPTAFLTGRHYGVFTVTMPASQAEAGARWQIEANQQMTSVPGRPVSSAYQLDRIPRPHGTLAPFIRFVAGGPAGQYPPGIVADRVETVKVGELLTLTVFAEDPSVRDPADYRFKEPLDLNVSWYKHQGPPGEIEWVRDPSTVVEPPDSAAVAAAATSGRPIPEPATNQIELKGGRGTALVQARFPAPGEYMLRVRSDQWGSAPDSSGGDQCCWTNGYVRVTVTP
jgi:hypothetical protein